MASLIMLYLCPFLKSIDGPLFSRIFKLIYCSCSSVKLALLLLLCVFFATSGALRVDWSPLN